MTLAEFDLYCAGYADRLDLYMDMLAQHASWVMRPHLKQAVDPRKLRPGKRKKGGDEDKIAEHFGVAQTAADFRKVMNEKREKREEREFWGDDDG